MLGYLSADSTVSVPRGEQFFESITRDLLKSGEYESDTPQVSLKYIKSRDAFRPLPCEGNIWCIITINRLLATVLVLLESCHECGKKDKERGRIINTDCLTSAAACYNYWPCYLLACPFTVCRHCSFSMSRILIPSNSPPAARMFSWDGWGKDNSLNITNKYGHF